MDNKVIQSISFDIIFDSLEKYQSALERQIVDLSERERFNINKQFEEINQKSLSSIEKLHLEISAFDSSFEIESIYGYFIPTSFRYSLVVLICLSVEKCLTDFCDHLQEVLGIPIKAKDLKGDTIERAKVYIHKLAGLKNFKESNWEKIKNLFVIRNCIVHCMGDVGRASNPTELRFAVKNSDCRHISINGESEVYCQDPTFFPEGHLIISDEYCLYAIKETKSFFDQLIYALKQ